MMPGARWKVKELYPTNSTTSLISMTLLGQTHSTQYMNWFAIITTCNADSLFANFSHHLCQISPLKWLISISKKHMHLYFFSADGNHFWSGWHSSSLPSEVMEMRSCVQLEVQMESTSRDDGLFTHEFPGFRVSWWFIDPRHMLHILAVCTKTWFVHLSDFLRHCKRHVVVSIYIYIIIILYYIILYYILLYYIIFFCIILYYIFLYDIILYHMILYFIFLLCIYNIHIYIYTYIHIYIYTYIHIYIYTYIHIYIYTYIHIYIYTSYLFISKS